MRGDNDLFDLFAAVCCSGVSFLRDRMSHAVRDSHNSDTYVVTHIRGYHLCDGVSFLRYLSMCSCCSVVDVV